MGLLENIITLINKYFYKTEEKPVKYREWLTSKYINGKWYIQEQIQYNRVEQTIISVSVDQMENQYGGYTYYIEVSGGDNRQNIDLYAHEDDDIEVESIKFNTNLPNTFLVGTTDTEIEIKSISISPYTDSNKGIIYNGCRWNGTPTIL